MDMIYTNAKRVDQGVLLDYEMDLAFGADENNFECVVAYDSHCCEAGSFLYMEGTEYGGIVDAIQSKSDTKEVIYSGRTWHGILGSKIILPLQKGEASTASVTLKTTDGGGNSLIDRYLILSGDANACLQFLINRLGLSDMYKASSTAAGVNINRFQFDRFADAYSGIVKMLSSAGLKLKLVYSGGMVELSASAKYDYSQDEEFDSDLVEVSVKKAYKTVNHLICLGKGELENRTVVHLFTDAEGNISQTQTLFGCDEYVAIYDYSAVESEEELISSGKDKLKALWEQDKLSVDFDAEMDSYDVGDIVGAVDNITGLSISATITKKVVTIRNGQITVALSTDEMSSSGGNATGNGTASNGVVDVDIEPKNGAGFTTVVGNNKSKAVSATRQVFVNVRLDITTTAEVAAGASITIGKVSTWFPGVMSALAVFVGSNSPRRYVGAIDLAGNIYLRASTAMEAGSYQLYLATAYVAV